MWTPRVGDRARALTAVAALLLTAATTATATASQLQHVRLTAAGQAAARSAMLRAADLGTGGKWVRVASVADGGSSSGICPDFHPKDSDLVTNGHAETTYKASGIQIGTTADVFASERMSLLIWQRMVQSPKLTGCLAKAFVKGAVEEARAHKEPLPRLVSARRVAYAVPGARTAAFRFLMDVPTSQGDVRMMGDMIFIGHKRTHLLMLSVAPSFVSSFMTKAEARLGRVVVGRMLA